MEIFVGRQPIFNAQKQIVAYELLYRSSKVNAFPTVDSDIATLEVLVNSFLLIDQEKVTKGKPSFINFTENILNSDVIDFLEPSQVVIEILEDVPITDKVVQRVRDLKIKGFKIALDDFILQEHVKNYDELFELVDYIKIDFMQTSATERATIERRVQEKFPNIKLLAEKVERYDEFNLACTSGYELFQGYFFEKPQILKGTTIPPNTIQYLNTLLLLNEPDPNVQLIAENIERDLSLTYKLLKMVNNATVQIKANIQSITQAIMMIGIPNLRKWIYFIAMSEQQRGEQGEFFEEVMRTSLFRAKVCEILAKRANKVNAAEYFLTGMFSLIDTLLKSDIKDIVQKLPLSDNVTNTLLGQQTEITPYLQFSIILGRLEWDKLEQAGEAFQLDVYEMDELYNEALIWAENSL